MKILNSKQEILNKSQIPMPQILNRLGIRIWRIEYCLELRYSDFEFVAGAQYDI